MSTEVKAKLKQIRISPRKVRLVADLVRGKKAKQAVNTLSLLNKKSAKPLIKLIKSAIANAKNDFELEEGNLRISKLSVDEGPTYKRWMPRARGRATTIRKRTSKIEVILTSIVEPIEKLKEKKTSAVTVPKQVETKKKTEEKAVKASDKAINK
ncbi:MAG: 50S ribosomal protein L22 [bacterium]